MKTSQKVALTLGGAILALGGTAGVASMASAETPTPTPSSSATAAQPTDQQPMPERGPRHRDGEDAAALAKKLGLDQAKVQAAMDAARQSTRPSTKPTTPPTDAEREASRAAYITALAKELGVDESKVKTALDELRSEATAAAKQAFADKLAQAVKDGKLTQAEADAVQKAADAGVIGYGGGPR